jgi:hypothetical protein
MSALFLESRDKNLAYRVDLWVFLETFADAQLAVSHVSPCLIQNIADMYPKLKCRIAPMFQSLGTGMQIPMLQLTLLYLSMHVLKRVEE